MEVIKMTEKGRVTLPAEIMRKAGLEGGDLVKITLEGSDQLSIQKISSLSEVQKKLAGKLPSWREIEGKSDELAEKEI